MSQAFIIINMRASYSPGAYCGIPVNHIKRLKVEFSTGSKDRQNWVPVSASQIWIMWCSPIRSSSTVQKQAPMKEVKVYSCPVLSEIKSIAIL